MDTRTVAAYNRLAADFADEWEAQPAAVDVYALVEQYFRAGGVTADIGCGSGRDTAWLTEHGYRAVGFDVSPALLEQARRRHPGIRFTRAELPQLGALAATRYDNVFCETVIMHLEAPEVAQAVRRLVEILTPSGTLYLSWRAGGSADVRDRMGRLYSVFERTAVLGALAPAVLLHSAQVTSESSGRVVERIVARAPRCAERKMT